MQFSNRTLLKNSMRFYMQKPNRTLLTYVKKKNRQLAVA